MSFISFPKNSSVGWLKYLIFLACGLSMSISATRAQATCDNGGTPEPIGEICNVDCSFTADPAYATTFAIAEGGGAACNDQITITLAGGDKILYTRDCSALYTVPTWVPDYLLGEDPTSFSCAEIPVGSYSYIVAEYVQVNVGLLDGTCSCDVPTECANIPGSSFGDECATFGGDSIGYVPDPSAADECLCPCPNQLGLYDTSDFAITKGSDVMCFGGNDGELTLTESTADYDLTDFDLLRTPGGSTAATISTLVAGSYTVNIHPDGYADATCDFTRSATINQPTDLVIDSVVPTDPNCAGNNGAITVNVSGGTTPYAITINGGTPMTNSTGVFTNLAAGTYTISVLDDNSCSETTTSVTLTDVSCDDSNACTTDVCNAGTCENDPITCDDGIACTIDSCDTILGCEVTPDDTVCDTDGDICTDPICDVVTGCEEVFDATNDPTCDCNNETDPDQSCTDKAPACHTGVCEVTGDCTFIPINPNLGNACTSDPNVCGETEDGTELCDRSCSAGPPSAPTGYGSTCDSDPNNCGITTSGVIGCDGSCDATPPADVPGVGDSCTSDANTCGDTNTGFLLCDGTCDVTIPSDPSNLGDTCTSGANNCGTTNSGTIDCDGECSVSAPEDIILGSCESAPNCVGDTNSGTLDCNGVCDAVVPTNPSTCDDCTSNPPSNLGDACEGPENTCGFSNAGAIDCDGECSATDTPDLPTDFGTTCTVTNVCGESSDGTIQCDGSCSAVMPGVISNLGDSCTSAANLCGETQDGVIECDGTCSVSEPPTLPPTYNDPCTATNACGASNPGVIQCDGSCNATMPSLPATYNTACTSSPNCEGATNPGVILCDGSCNATPPADTSACDPLCGGTPPADYGDTCFSTPNSCGISNEGTIDCDGDCTAIDVLDPVGLGSSCDSSPNSCGALDDTGEIQCDGSCDAIVPGVPSDYGDTCSGGVNNCGLSETGVIGCASDCSASIPTDVVNIGSSCISAANICGDTNPGTVQCLQSCDAIAPLNPASCNETFSCDDIFALSPSITGGLGEDITTTLTLPAGYTSVSLDRDSGTVLTAPANGTHIETYATGGTYVVTYTYEDDSNITKTCSEDIEITVEEIPGACPDPQTIYSQSFDLASNLSYVSCDVGQILTDTGGTPLLTFDGGTNTWTWTCLGINNETLTDTCSLTKARCGDAFNQGQGVDSDGTPYDETCDDGNADNDLCTAACELPVFDCIVDTSVPGYANHDPANYPTTAIFCKDAPGNVDLRDELSSELTLSDRYRDRVNEGQCTAGAGAGDGTHCQRYIPGECGVLDQSEQVLFSYSAHTDPLERCKYGSLVPSAGPASGNYVFSGTGFPFEASWNCPSEPGGGFDTAIECSLEVYPPPSCADVNINIPATGTAGTPVTIGFDSSGTSRAGLVNRTASIGSTAGGNLVGNDVTYTTDGLYSVQIVLDDGRSDTYVTCTKSIIVGAADTPDPIDLDDDDDLPGPCGPAAGETISYTDLAITSVFDVTDFCDVDFSPVVSFDSVSSSYYRQCPEMTTDVCSINVLPDTVSCDDAGVVYGGVNPDFSIDLGSTLSIDWGTFVSPGVTVSSMELVGVQPANTNGGGVITEAIHPQTNYAINDTLTVEYSVIHDSGAQVECTQEITVIGQPEECGPNARTYAPTEIAYDGTTDSDYCDTGAPSGSTLFPGFGDTESWDCGGVTCEATREDEPTECGWAAEAGYVSTFFDAWPVTAFKSAYCDEPSGGWDDMDMQNFAQAGDGRTRDCVNTQTSVTTSCEVGLLVGASCGSVGVAYDPGEFVGGTVETIQVTSGPAVSVDSVSYPDGGSSWTILNDVEIITEEVVVSVSNDSGGSAVCSFPLIAYPTVVVTEGNIGGGGSGSGAPQDTAFCERLNQNGFDLNDNCTADYNEDPNSFGPTNTDTTDSEDSTPPSDETENPDDTNTDEETNLEDDPLISETSGPEDDPLLIPSVNQRPDGESEECYSDDGIDCPSADSASSSFDTSFWSDAQVTQLGFVQNGACVYNGPSDNNIDFGGGSLTTNESWFKILVRLGGMIEGQVVGPQQMEVHGEALLEAGIISSSAYNELIQDPFPQGTTNEVFAIGTIGLLREFKGVPQDIIDTELTQIYQDSDGGAFTRFESLQFASQALEILENHATQQQCLDALLMQDTEWVGIPN